MNAAEVLREARNVLFERGWHKGGIEGTDGSLCALGAIDRAARGGMGSQSDPFLAASRALQSVVGARSIGSWNDADDRTFDEVLEAFDKAEKIAEASA